MLYEFYEEVKKKSKGVGMEGGGCRGGGWRVEGGGVCL